MKIKTIIPQSMRNEACALIDASAEETRGKYITLGSGQALVYNQKATEAELYISGNYQSVAELPHLVAEAEMNNISLMDQAVEYLTMRQLWLSVSPTIENKRQIAKKMVNEATSKSDIEAAVNIDWSNLPHI